MKIFLSGCHGVGKTTLLNTLQTNRPLAKFTDVDMLYSSGVGFSQQMKRHENFRKIMAALPDNVNCIIDRSHIDHLVYDSIVTHTSEEKHILAESYQKNLAEPFSHLKDTLIIGIIEPLDTILDRIRKRNRSGLNEEDVAFTTFVYKNFNLLYENCKREKSERLFYKTEPYILTASVDEAKPLLERLLA